VSAEFRQYFPIFSEKPDLVYLDHGATSQKAKPVIDRLTQFYTSEYGTIHRGVYDLSIKATDYVDEARSKLKEFVNAEHDHEIIFTRGTTESINLVAFSFGAAFVKPGDEILITEMEHHANILPWQLLCERTGASLKVLPFDDNGELQMDRLDALLSEKTKLVAVVHISNSLGTINPIEEIIRKSHKVGAKVLIDGAQAVSHIPVDVRALNCDFYVCSSHKMFGPSGVGVLYGKQDLLNDMPPFQSGGDMIEVVTFEKSTFAPLPAKFEAGTPAIAEIIALGVAVDFIKMIGFDRIQEHDAMLLEYGTTLLSQIKGLTIIGTAANKSGVISFIMDGAHPHDIGTILDQSNVAVRAGHHCTQPVMSHFGVPATSRASFSIYNTREDFDKLAVALKEVQRLFC